MPLTQRELNGLTELYKQRDRLRRAFVVRHRERYPGDDDREALKAWEASSYRREIDAVINKRIREVSK